MTRVVLIRHGETDWNREGRMQGWAPTPLNERGREQASAVGAYVAEEYDVDRAFSSDLKRTRETTERVLESVGDVPVSYEPHWRERDMGVYQGLTYADVEERFPRFGLGESAHEAAAETPEGGESLADLAGRVTRRFEEVVADHAGETLLVVGHGGTLHVLLGYVKGMALPEALGAHHQHNCAVNEVLIDGGVPRVVREDVTEWEALA